MRATEDGMKLKQKVKVLSLAMLVALGAPLHAADFEITLDGCTFTEANFEGFAYADQTPCTGGFLPMMSAWVNEMAGAWVGTSGSSLAIGTGSKSLTLSSGRAFATGQPVRIASTAAPTVDFMDGTITAWNAETFAMTVLVDAVAGSGTLTSWSVYVMRNESTTVSSPLAVASGGTGGTTALTARQSLGVTETRFFSSRQDDPPGSPSSGDRYLIGPNPTGDWSSNANEYTEYDGADWQFEAPNSGDTVYVEHDATEHQSTINGANTRVLIWDADVARWFGPGGSPIDHVISASVTVSETTLSGRPAARFRKTSNTAYTLTLPNAFGNFAAPTVIVANTGTSDITVNVTGGGTVNGAGSVAVAQNVVRAFVQVSATAWRSVSVY